MNLATIIRNFNTTPFLFLGSGITRRYYNLPNWECLLKHFAFEINHDDLTYSFYKNKASQEDLKYGILPKVAELIQIDYEAKWFKDPTIRHVSNEILADIRDKGISPFKAEIAQFIKDNSVLKQEYVTEVGMLAELSVKNITGVITTNYDSFIENYFTGYVKYIGQKQLIFSPIQGVAEIFKIHGSIEQPESIVINEKDYDNFERNSEYLAAKLMTIFMEYPMIFIGYSISDTNIQNILGAIVQCLDENQLKRLEERFLFVEYEPAKKNIEISPFTIMFDGKPLTMKKIVADDFKPIYKALGEIKSKLPARIIRKFKQDLYELSQCSSPTAKIMCAEFDDSRINDDDLVLSIGKRSDFGVKGITGIDGSDWYRNIILNDLQIPADELLTHAFEGLYKQYSRKLPLNKYLSEAHDEYPECMKAAREQRFDSIISNTIKNGRCRNKYKSVKEVCEQEKDVSKATLAMAHLTEAQIEVDALEKFLKEIFESQPEILSTGKSETKTNIRRIIRIYDYLRWGKELLD